MTSRTRYTLVLLLILFLGAEAGPVRAQPQGEVSVNPNWGISGDFGTWTVTYRVGPQGIDSGGGLRVQLPDSWHAGERNSAYPLQATRPKADHYISARASRPGVELKTTVESESNRRLAKSDRPGLDGRMERYIFVTRVEVEEGQLQPGDSLSVIYGDTSQGSRGMRVGVISTPPQPVLIAIDTNGDGNYELHPDHPLLTLRSGPPADLLVSGPSSLVKGEPAELQIALVDEHFNPVESYQGDMTFEVVKGQAEVPSSVSLDLEKGWTTFSFTPTANGILRMEAEAAGGLFEAKVNPMKVTDELPDRQVYWGDLHSHSKYSWDGVGESPFAYARNVARLDFYALTDHSIPAHAGHTHGLGKSVWEEYTALAEEHYAPGRFVTLHAYEASFGAPYGHHNVFFRGEPGPLLVSNNYEAPDSIDVVTLPEMWEKLEEGEALTIPHHTGKMPRPVRWTPHDSTFRRNFEIYSGHGLSEAYNPEHPLAFEQSNFTSPSTSAEGPQYVQDAWEQDLVLSTIAASDDHRAQPGKPHLGLTAVRSTRLTRPEIFDALYERNTYGTTGARILLNFTVNGAPMGSQVTVRELPRLDLEIHGTDEIEWIEVLRYSEAEGAFRVIYTIHPDALDFSWSRVDRSIRDDAIYYVRLKQRGMVQNRIAMAWSSPIWVKHLEGDK